MQACCYALKIDLSESVLPLEREQGIGYVPFFPLGGFTPLQSETLSNVAAHLNAKPMERLGGAT